MRQYIGVDPAYRKNGFYICVIVKEAVTFVKIINFIDYVKFIDSVSDSGIEAVIAIENSNETNHTFIAQSIRKPEAREKISRDVGKNQAISQMAVDYALYKLKNNVYSLSPAEKGVKLSNAYIEAMFKQYSQTVTNYKGKEGEQDKRDAYKLAMQAKNRAISSSTTVLSAGITPEQYRELINSRSIKSKKK
jgi:hypothetical protein